MLEIKNGWYIITFVKSYRDFYGVNVIENGAYGVIGPLGVAK